MITKYSLFHNCLLFSIIFSFISSSSLIGQQQAQIASFVGARERLLMDFGWRFAYGHAVDAQRDFCNGTGFFSYFVKAGYGDGAASSKFDDRSWRVLNLPHDWAVELPFDSNASYSHGYKTVGRNYPETSIGWYRKTFVIPATDLGKHITIEFDGVFRNSIAWLNGFYLGEEHSGYAGFQYDITDYINYGGENVVAVRVDATMEGGWFYKGAGIYRHVWLNKTTPLHIAPNGIFVSSDVNENAAGVTARTTIVHKGKNIYAVVGTPLVEKFQWDDLNTDPGILQVALPADTWKRKAFNGLTQVIIQSSKEPGINTLKAASNCVTADSVQIQSQKSVVRPSDPE
ncbi:MAG: sugar-binding domain-containing protein [Bacteroidota bacterium]